MIFTISFVYLSAQLLYIYIEIKNWFQLELKKTFPFATK